MDGRIRERRYDIDWLRVFATYMLFVFHVTMVFNPAPFYHIRNDDLSFGMSVFAGFVHLWHMPLFFLLAGWSMWPSLEARGTRGFLWERGSRLGVPFLVGCVLLIPPIKYVELRSGLDFSSSGLRVAPHLQESFAAVIPGGLPVAPPFDESFWQFLPTFFTEPTRFSWAHLWFLAYLSTFTLLYLPAFLWLRRRPRLPCCTSSLVAYSPIVPLVMIQLVLRPHWPGRLNLYDDWANFAYYSTFMVVGFLLARYPVLEQTTYLEWKRALLVGLGTTLVLLLGVMGVFDSEQVLLAGSAVAGWCFVLGMLGFARAFLTFSNRLHRYLTESALPIYLLHQSAIVLPGYFLVRLQLGMAAKYGMLLSASVVTTLIVYHFGVRPFSIPRLLCGLRPLPGGMGRTGTAMERPARTGAPV